MKTTVKKTSRKRTPRPYSREFTKAPEDKGRILKIRGIPSDFWARVMKKARREGIAVRNKVLRDLDAWVNEDRRAS